MTGRFFDKLRGRSQSPEVAEALADLDRLAREHPSLARPAALLAEVLPILGRPGPPPPPLGLDQDRAAAKLAEGIPLLRGEPASLDPRALRGRWADLCTAALRHHRPDAAPALAAAVATGRLDLEDWAALVLAGQATALHTRAESLGLDPGLAATVLRLTLFPDLAARAAALEPLRQDRPWEHGWCPTCGSWPLLGEFRGLEQTRWLRCGLCASEWEFPRLGCPYCGSRDHEQLGYLHVAGEEARCRAATCDACHGYVKMLATLGRLPPLRLLVADLETLHLDLAAAERGYAIPA